ncbi:succinate dehydrogenase, hydrophobic membrane anchor protein [Chromobacterium violaceum]|uniref:Succinate dehydrogenase, hydrophobic membrane anchor protein n=1 Tax=Chromobacterium violaceum TaxID=536 RepID=A0A447T843_CHRVL|nr:succinate dehydrogenase, hydrophobic membrane anchor protein [Chromobacterium violaceum]
MVNRHVVGAGYGLRDWIMQRVTAVVMVLYTVALALFLLALRPATKAGSLCSAIPGSSCSPR